MARLKASNDRNFLKGIPEVWTVVLDRMACDESIRDVRAVLRTDLTARLARYPEARIIAEDFCLNSIVQNANPVLDPPLSALASTSPTVYPGQGTYFA